MRKFLKSVFVFVAATVAEDIEDLQLLQVRVGEFNQLSDEVTAEEIDELTANEGDEATGQVTADEYDEVIVDESDDEEATVVGSSATCDFEGSLCGWTQSTGDQFDWSFRSGSTPSKTTGPAKAFKGQQYLFIEASNPRKTGDKAILTAAVQVSAGTVLSFAYSMYGKSMGGLDVLVDGVVAFQKAGDLKTDAWQKAQIDLSQHAGKTVKVQIIGVRGSSWAGDLAIDDLEVTIPVATVDATCDFEGSLCGWKQSTVDQFDWSFRSGSTPSGSTGPDKAFKGKQYLFIEASNPRKTGDKAILTGAVQVSAGSVLSFAYSMWGKSMGGLDVLVDGVVAFQKAGDLKTPAWQKAQIDLNQYAGRAVKVQIIGVRGSSWSGDLAIDDLAVTNGAPVTTATTTATTTTKATTTPPKKLPGAVDGVYDNQRTKTVSTNIVAYKPNITSMKKCLCEAKSSKSANSAIVAVNYHKPTGRCIFLKSVSVSHDREATGDWSTSAMVTTCKTDKIWYDVPKDCSGLRSWDAVKCNKLIAAAGYTSRVWIDKQKCLVKPSSSPKMYDWRKAQDYCLTGNSYCNGIAKLTVKQNGKYVNEYSFCKAWMGQFSTDDLPATWPYGGVMEVLRKPKVELAADEFDKLR